MSLFALIRRTVCINGDELTDLKEPEVPDTEALQMTRAMTAKRAEAAMLVRISYCFSVSLTFFPIRPLLDLAIFVTL